MEYIEKYDKNKTYYFQNGRIAEYEQLRQQYPAIDTLPYIVHTDYKGNVILVIEMLNVKRTELNIDEELSDDEAIEAIKDILNNVDNSNDDMTRLADALEDLVVLQMPDESEVE